MCKTKLKESRCSASGLPRQQIGCPISRVLISDPQLHFLGLLKDGLPCASLLDPAKNTLMLSIKHGVDTPSFFAAQQCNRATSVSLALLVVSLRCST